MQDQLAALIKSLTAIAPYILVGLAILIYFIVDKIAEVRKRAAFEESRREIAAYVAEGAITPEAAATLLAMKPGKRPAAPASCEDDDSDLALTPDQRLAKAVSDDELDADDARRLIDERGSLDDKAWAHAVDLTLRGMPSKDALRLARVPRQDAANPKSDAAYPQQATPFVGS